jgi:hypothetical protein
MEKTVKIDVTIRYKVCITGIKMDTKAYKEAKKAEKNLESIELSDFKYPNASEWFRAYIHERDAYDWDAEIDELTLIENENILSPKP